MELYGALASPYVARVILFARLKGIDLPLAEVPGGWSGSPEYKALSPIGKIPALNVDGQCIPESETICEYLEDTYPDKPGLPADTLGRAQSRTISRIVDLYMSPISNELARQVKPEKRDDAVVAKNAEACTTVWTYLEHFMGDGPFAVGTEPTLGDCALGPHMVMFKVLAFDTFDSIADPTQAGGRLQSWWEAMQGHEACRGLLDEYAAAFEAMMAYFRK
ncbi:MAG TPA: glutathione S-transferase family protein [Gammaproteobacteria bacterium]|jgi:glutathione S-transferase|nr:glutathione S-transferase family protein [Gammaproteobacteria bacterium]MDP6151452.1 glutathione S-transferase family protein [Gammaproteobacteria bacterium]HJP39507.1 glutathione S-transferase family protein [Gammaproteobacteria bacterium]